VRLSAKQPEDSEGFSYTLLFEPDAPSAAPADGDSRDDG
jgi:hypothetical protein